MKYIPNSYAARLLHYSAKPFTLNPRRTYQQERERDHKPAGLWLSVEGEYDWKYWSEAESFNLDAMKNVSEIALKADANILVIDSVKKLDAFNTLYGNNDPHELRGIEWRKVVATHDGIIIAPYYWERRISLMWYYTWDCASGVIWNLKAINQVRPYATLSEVK